MQKIETKLLNLKAVKEMEDLDIKKEEVEDFIYECKLKNDSWYKKVKKYVY